MKRIVVKGYICPACGAGIRLTRPDIYTRCGCGKLAMYGNPEDPVVVCGSPEAPKKVDSIIPVPDDYRYPKCGTGGVIYANPRKGTTVGLSQAQMDMVMPLLAFSKAMGWNSDRLLTALETFQEYEEIITSDL